MNRCGQKCEIKDRKCVLKAIVILNELMYTVNVGSNFRKSRCATESCTKTIS